MKKTFIGMKLWEVIYPIGIYFVVSNIAMVMLGFVWGEVDGNTYLIWQLIANVVSLPFLFSFYQRKPKDADTKVSDGAEVGRKIGAVLGLAIAVAMAGIVVNNLIGLTPLAEQSKTFQEVNESFYGGTLIVEVIVLCVATPLLEEFLYRGIVYTKLREWVGMRRGIVISAFLFGIMHFNLVQFLYAFTVGLLLAAVMERGGLQYAFAAHGLTNLLSILRSEVPVLHQFLNTTGMCVAEILMAVVIGLIAWFVGVKMVKK